jgi:hypothetical protein
VAKNLENIFPGLGGMNYDDEDRLIPDGDYRDAINIGNGSSMSSEDGAVHKRKSNVKIDFLLPAGVNTNVGSVRDPEGVNVIYFNHNSNSDHGIYRFNRVEKAIYKVSVSSTWNFSLEPGNRVHGDIINKESVLFNDDYNPPRKLNFVKSESGTVKRKFSLVVDKDQDYTDVNISYVLSDSTGVEGAETVLMTGESFDDYDTFIRRLKLLISCDTNLSIISEQDCGDCVEYEFDNEGDYDFRLVTDLGILSIPDNYYTELPYELTQQVHPTLICPPTITLESDSTREVNYLNRLNFQVRSRLVYDDFERSVFGAASNLSIDGSGSCSGVAGTSKLNCLSINFNDPWLADRNYRSRIKKVELAFRTSNNGPWKIVDTIEQCDIGVNVNQYKFYNDQSSQEIVSDIEANNNFHDVPLLSKTQEYAKNRIWHGNVLEGYDKTCLDAKLDVEYGENIIPDTYTVSGRIRINNSFADDSDYRTSQPIHDFNDGNGTVWGGIGKNSVVGSVSTKYNQELPLKGFVAYLAGTDMYAVSKQNRITTDDKLEYTDRNVVITDWGGGRRSAVRRGINDDNFYSDFKIKNVPPGRYILRIASHYTTQAELNSFDRTYQKTSTNVSKMQGTLGRTEILIEVTSSNVNATSSGDIIVEDLTGTALTEKTLAISGYLTDDDVTVSGSPTTEELYADKRIENARVAFNAGGFNFLNTIGSAFLSGDNLISYTDHNGFFFFGFASTIADFSTSNLTINSGESRVLEDLLQEDAYLIEGAAASIFTGAPDAEQYNVLIRAKNTQISDFNRTTVSTKFVTPEGAAAPGVGVVVQNGDVNVADVGGVSKVIVYGDTKHYDDFGFRSTNSRKLISFSQSSGCSFLINDNYISFELFFNDTANYHYDDEFSYDTQDVEAEQLTGGNSPGLKRGGEYQYGLVYRDFAQRSNGVSATDETKLHISFYTEKNDTGEVDNNGIPTVSWCIYNTPPVWATHYSWVRTKNEATRDYLQFPINKATYLDDAGNTSNFNDGTKIKLSLSNLGDYAIKHPNSKVGILPDEEYRVRFISYPSGNPIPEYIDLEVLESDGVDITVYNSFALGTIIEGTLIEVYRPRREDDIRIFYEVGGCFKISDGKHLGQSQNQYDWDYTTVDDDGGKVRFNGVTPELVIGDKILVKQSKGYIRDEYNIVTTVTGVTGTSITTDIDFIGGTPDYGGVICRPSCGVFSDGDAYYRSRTVPTESGQATSFVDDACVSDFYDSNDQGIGRAYGINPDQKQERRGEVFKFSGKIIEGTSINNLNEFLPSQSDVVDQANGDINKLILSENVLIAICEFRWASIYVNERVISQPDGTTDLAVTSDVVGTIRNMRGKWGTVNPESVAEYQGNIFAWDLNKGVVVRYSNSGLVPISDLKMKNFFHNKSRDYLDGNYKGDSLVIGAYDPYYNEYILSFKGLGELNDDSIVFTEGKDKDRWTSRWEYAVEGMDSVVQDIISFKNGELWLHNSGDDYNKLYDEIITSKITVVFNDDPKSVKVYKVLSEETEEVWSAESLIVPVPGANILDMQSRIKSGRFVNKEGVYFGKLLRDINTSGFNSESKALINGRELRGKVCIVTLCNDSEYESVLFDVNMSYNRSEFTNK